MDQSRQNEDPGATQPVTPSKMGEAPTVADADLGKTTPLGNVVPRSSRAPRSGSSGPSKDENTDARKQRLDEESERLLGRTINGYRVEKLLGAGGMGAVYLAHQMSLDRKVALKVLPARLATKPELFARFTREALSAAQLNHHNVVQVIDVGSVDDVHYISMEFVKGQNLGDVIRRDGPLRIDDAASFVLQAARGLQYAHDRGVIHRDIKPDNIMVNEHGIVKIADLGLAKMINVQRGEPTGSFEDNRDELQRTLITPENLTLANTAFGTPAYMAPEQARDTRSVDPRADQYSLGCTLYYLCAGKAPYSGTTAYDLISKHLKEPLTPLDVHVHGVPPTFSRIVQRMLAKDPKERYSSMKDVAADIEAFLGIESHAGSYRPRDQHLGILEKCHKDYYSTPSMKKRRLVQLVFMALMPILIVASFLTPSVMFKGVAVGLFLLVPLVSFIINGMARKTPLYLQARSVFFGMGLKSWLKLVGAAALVAAVVVVMGWWLAWLIVGVLAVGLAIAYKVVVLRPLEREREPIVKEMNAVLKELRIRGVDEDVLQEFVCKFTGTDWEEFFEEFFSYDDKMLWRSKGAAAEKVKARRKFATWRDPLYRWLNNLEEKRKTEREKAQLKKVEKERLKAEGLTEEQADEAADAEATRILDEGLIKKVDDASDLWKPKQRVGIVAPVFKFATLIARLALGVVMLAGFAGPLLNRFGVPIPEAVKSFLNTYYFAHNDFASMHLFFAAFGGLAGLILLLSVFSRQVFACLLVLIGGILLAVPKLLIEASPSGLLNPVTTFWAGLGLVGLGFVLMVFSKMTGSRF